MVSDCADTSPTPRRRRRRSVLFILFAVRAREAEAAVAAARAGVTHVASHHRHRVERGGGVLAGVLTRRFGKHKFDHHGAGRGAA